MTKTTKKRGRPKKPAILSMPSQPVDPSKYPDPPKELEESGIEHWKIGEPLWNEGRLTARDLPNWLLYCAAWDELKKVEALVEEQGEYHYTQNGYPVEHPGCKRLDRIKNRIVSIGKLYGLAPDQRRKSPVAPSQQGVKARKRG